jgi:AcrR family transcriptional regulator
MPKVTEEHREARRRQILAAASRCFARKGLHRTSMQDIIDESGLSTGAIYSYYKGKDEIFQAIADARHQREAELLSDALDSAELEDALRALSETFVAELADPQRRLERLVSIDLWAEALRNPKLAAIVRRGVDQPREAIADLVRRAQQRGEIPPDVDADGLARVVIAGFHGFVLQHAWDKSLDIEPFLATTRRLMRALVAEAREPA